MAGEDRRLLLMNAQTRCGAPTLVGTAGQAGGDLNVDWTADIVREIARERGHRPKVAVICSEQSAETMKVKNGAGRIRPPPPLGRSTRPSTTASTSSRSWVPTPSSPRCSRARTS